MSDTFSLLSEQIASAIDRAAISVVQVQGHRRPTAGVVFANDLILVPASAVDDDTTTIRLSNGQMVEGTVLGRAYSIGLAVVRVTNLGVAPLAPAAEPRVGHLAVAVGRTWSGGVMASVTNVTVIGGPLRTSKTSELRVIRIAQPPHGALVGGALIDGHGTALGLITGSAIRGTTVVLPANLIWPLGQQLADRGGTRQGFLGVSSSAVALPARQRAGESQQFGLLITSVVEESPAESAGLLVGDIIVGFDGQAVEDPETLVTLLRGDRVGKAAGVKVLRGGELREVSVLVGERPRRRERNGSR